MSMSVAVVIVLLLATCLLFIKKEYKMVLNLSLSISLFMIIFYLNNIVSYIEFLGIPEHKLMSNERVQSAYNRIEDITFYLNYLSSLDDFNKLFGEGAGSPFLPSYNHSMSIGWLVKFIESGIVGGTFYLITFLYLFILVVYNIIKKVTHTIDFYIVSFSILSLIAISTLRQPTDSSFWHMTFFAFYFHYLLKNDTYK